MTFLANPLPNHANVSQGASLSRNTVVIGQPPTFWLFSERDGWDLTHPPIPSSPPVYPRLTMRTSTSPVTIAPSKTALVIIDMQNFFLSTALGRKRGQGHDAEEVLLKHGIPAARKAGIQILWLTWGIPTENLKSIPPIIWRIFGWESVKTTEQAADSDDLGSVRERKSETGLGSSLGDVKLEDGTVVDAGRMLIRDQWNTALHAPLEAAFQEGLKAKVPDVRFHKERLSGTWGGSNDCERFLEKQGIKTLLFAGVNTDQCVLATLEDSCSKSWDTILLKDACGTTSPDYATKMVHHNCQKSWGFLSSCKELVAGVENLVESE
ncbi:hypothetical protein LTS15_008855 [Exophiala xenobiotica]|nr:hypothetical protein LTS15_008855 [Exophiala xenobiotica]